MTRLLSYRQVAEKFSGSEGTVIRWRRQGRITPIRISPGIVRFDEGEVERSLTVNEQHREAAEGGEV